MLIIGIDPGPKYTGLVKMRAISHEDFLLHGICFTGTRITNTIDIVKEIGRAWIDADVAGIPLHIGCEDIQPYLGKGTIKKRNRGVGASTFDTAKMIGAIEHICREAVCPFYCWQKMAHGSDRSYKMMRIRLNGIFGEKQLKSAGVTNEHIYNALSVAVRTAKELEIAL